MKKIYILLVTVCLGVFSLHSLKAQNNFDMLNLVGDAVPAGWYPGNPTPMYQSDDNANIFIWKGYLKAGEFKISTFIGDWCDGQWINPVAADQSISEGDFIVTTGCDGPDNKWRVKDEEAGNYTLTVDLETNKITVETLTGGYSNLYLVGDAAPAGWDIASPTPMTVLENNPNVFTWEGTLKAGEMKISTYTGDWCDGDWLVAAQPDQSISETSLIITNCEDGPDNKWKILDTEAGNYLITVDVLNQKIFFELSSGIYNELFLVGDATPTGWNIQQSTPMTRDDDNPNLFTWSGTLLAGEMKISTFQGELCDGDWLVAAQPDQSISDTTLMITTCEGPDNKWIILDQEAGDYLITVDVLNETIFFEPSSGGIYNGLFLVGDATPAGWSIEAPTPMTPDDDNPNLFTWSGTLKVGEFKFSTFQSTDWCGGDWLLATAADQVLTATDYTIYSGCAPTEEDYKWKVTTESEYSIVIDLELETIVITDLNTSQENIPAKIALRVYPNPAADKIYFDLAGENSADIRIYNLAGQLLLSTRISDNNNGINIAELSSNNLLVIQVATPLQVQMVKVVVK